MAGVGGPLKRHRTEKNPDRPSEENRPGKKETYRTYRMRLRTTPAQRTVLKEWMAAGRMAYNALLAAHRDPVQRLPLSIESANGLARQCNLWMPESMRRAKVYRCVYKNAMVDLVRAEEANQTKQRKNPRHRWTYRERSLRNTATETVRLDAAKFWASDRRQANGDAPTAPIPTAAPQDSGPVLRIYPVPGPVAGRVRAHVFMGGRMKALGPLVVRDRAWLVDRIVADRYLRHEGKLQWDKRRGAFYLCVTLEVVRPPDPDPDGHRKRVVALDPGVRRFQTLYDPATGTHGELLSTYHRIDHADRVLESRPVAEELRRRCHRIDALQSRVRSAGVWRARGGGTTGRAGRRWQAAAIDGTMEASELQRRTQRRIHQARRQTRRALDRERQRLHGFKHSMHSVRRHDRRGDALPILRLHRPPLATLGRGGGIHGQLRPYV